MSTWVSAAPVIGAGSLDGFAIGALMTGACALAVTAPRRSRGRKAPSARDRALAAEEAGWLCEHVMAAEAAGAEVAAEAEVAGRSAAFAAALVLASGETPPDLTSAATPPGLTSAAIPPGLPSALIPPELTSAAYAPRLPSLTMRTAVPSAAVPPELVAAAMAPGLVAQAVASALAAAPVGAVLTAEAPDPLLAAAPVGPVQAADAAVLTLAPAAAAPAPGAEAFEASAERPAPYQEFGAGRRGAARVAGSYRSRHRLGDPVPGSMPRDGAELVFPDPHQSGRAPGSTRRTQARRLPRHAAPSVSFGSRITGFGGRMTGLFAPRALATGARG